MTITQSKKPWFLIITRRDPTKFMSGDTRRVMEWVAALRESHCIAIVCYDKLSNSRHTDFGIIVSVKFSLFQFLFNALTAVLSGAPIDTKVFMQKLFINSVDEISRTYSITEGLIHLVRFGAVGLKFEKKIRWVFEATDSISLNYGRSAKTSSFCLKWFWALQAKKLLKAERQFISTFPVSSFISLIDKKFILNNCRGLSSSHVSVVPNPVIFENKDHFTRQKVSKQLVLVFIGRLAYRPNHDALNFILNKVLPLLKARGVVSSFRIIGSDCPPRLKKKLQTNPIIDFRPNEPDLCKALQDCDIGLCPVFTGAGLQNKLLDYVSAGLPVISSKRAALPFLKLLPALRNQINIPSPDSCPHAFVDQIFKIFEAGSSCVSYDDIIRVFGPESVRMQMRNIVKSLS